MDLQLLKKSSGKKASEKPIEIFVSLFVVLAVAMVLLKMFSSSTAQSQTQLTEFSSETEALRECETSCNKAKNNACDDQYLVGFCIKYVEHDFNGDSEIAGNKEEAFYYCEDRVYCPLVSVCECGVKLNMDNCVKIINRYYQEIGTSKDASSILEFSDPDSLQGNEASCGTDVNGNLVNKNDELSWYELFVATSS